MKLIVATPGRAFSNGYVRSIIDTMAFCMANHIDMTFSNHDAANLYTARTITLLGECTSMPARIMGGMDYDYVLMIDSDMVWRQEDIVLALEADRDVVTGVYAVGSNGKLAIAQTGEGGEAEFYNWANDLPEEPFKVDYAGLGFVLIRKGVFEALSWPWFNNKLEPLTQRWMGEDMSFSLDLREAGFDIWCHPGIRLGHQKYWTIYSTGEVSNG